MIRKLKPPEIDMPVGVSFAVLGALGSSHRCGPRPQCLQHGLGDLAHVAVERRPRNQARGHPLAVDPSKSATRMTGPACISNGMISRVAGSGRKRWTVRLRWSRGRRQQEPQRRPIGYDRLQVLTHQASLQALQNEVSAQAIRCRVLWQPMPASISSNSQEERRQRAGGGGVQDARSASVRAKARSFCGMVRGSADERTNLGSP